MNVSYKTAYTATTGLSFIIFLLAITGKIIGYNKTIFLVDSLIILFISLACWTLHDLASNKLEETHRTTYDIEDRNEMYKKIFNWWLGLLLTTIILSLIIYWIYTLLSAPQSW
ncbi:TPA: hypothetical protein HA235_01205 [Candidatus Woesearchaeota archaeon]|nr:hypothetical protein [Candidatus Woesearchaeota archaeon]HIH31301.1 hypothetical protein [Candidatus Woesearchaeota archaeon]HIH55408.1 hypothetical protein [Candidatus Woesearchaeota archaeon]HIJ01600.1 hypothetical protein [Candidatus Woesearchaeota archaeon]HIJ14599.1 hypothetical protein [Candidatus Woesearchaeota archaeon]